MPNGGTRVFEPAVGTAIDTTEIDFGGGDLRERQRVSLAGQDPNSDIAVLDAAPSGTEKGLAVRQVGSTPLSAGAATESSLVNILSALQDILTQLGQVLEVQGSVTISDGNGPVTVDGSVSVQGTVGVTGDFYQDTQPVSAVTLPLPTGAATEATLTTRSSETTLLTRASESTLTSRASEATLLTRASEASVAALPDRYAGGKTAYANTISASGSTTIITPSPGQRITVFWVSAQNDVALNSVGIRILIGSTPIYDAFAISHWEPFTGGVNESVIINLSDSVPVRVTIHYEEHL